MVSTLAKQLLILLSVVDAVVLASAGNGAATTSTQSVKVPATRPTGVPDVPLDFVGFGFESAFLDNYNNDFSSNLVDSIASRMGAPPIIRVGGTSGDRLHFNPNQQAATSCDTGKGGCPYGSSASFVLGPSYFDGFERFTNAKMTFQAPLGLSINQTNIQDYASRAYKALGANRTAAIAVGNEVNAYVKNASAYVSDVQAVQKILINELELSGSAQTILEVGDIASSAVGNPDTWTLADAFAQGLKSDKDVKYAAEHWYQDHVSTTLQTLMNHTAIVQKFKPYGEDLSYVKANSNATYVISETGDILADTSGLAPTFGGGLWSVDFQLYSMSRGVGRVAGSQRPAAGHSLWVPIAGIPKSKGPTVRAPFYAQPFVADLRGTAAQTGVYNLGLGQDFAAGYSVYEGQKLARMAFVNLREWNQGNGTRPVMTFSVNLPQGVSSVKAARLTAPAGAMAGGYDFDGQNITYAGMQWSYSVDNGKGHGTMQLEPVKVTQGTAQITVPDSSAVLLCVS